MEGLIMSYEDQMQLLAERKFLEERLAALPATSRITRISTESRLKSINERIGLGVSEDMAVPARVRLTFNGKPVVRSHGIYADFSMKAIASFTEAVTAMAASLIAPLAPKGPIPNKDHHQLLITGTAIGSFGFELEENCSENLRLEERSLATQALSQTQNLLYGLIGSDDDLAESASDTNPRALEKVKNFLQTLVDNDAVCAMGFQGKDFKFTDVGQVRSSLARLESDNLKEEEQSLKGEFQGVLPKGRSFEFKLAGEELIIRGKVGGSIPDPDVLNNQLHKLCEIKVMVTSVGNGKPRYVLMESPII
jgi:hypothetical protein